MAHLSPYRHITIMMVVNCCANNSFDVNYNNLKNKKTKNDLHKDVRGFNMVIIRYKKLQM